MNFLQQRMWWIADDAEVVDDVVVQAAIGIMTRKQFGWAKFISRQMKEDILQYLDGDEMYRSSIGLRSAQYLSMLIEFQIGAKQPPLNSSVTILDVEELLEDKEKRIFVLLKKLALLEEENTVHRQEAAQASAHHVETKDHLESLLVKAKKELAQLQVFRIEEQKVAATQLEDEKVYGKIVYKSYLTVKIQNRKVHDELEKARILNLTRLDELAEWKEKAEL